MRPALALAVIAALTVGSAALAGKREALARAKVGQKLVKDGDFLGALSAFNEAQSLSGNGWEYQYDIGVCESKLGHYTEALAAFDKFLKEGAAQIPRKMLDATLAQRDNIRSSTAEVTVRVEGDADVIVDGEPVGAAPLSRALILAPGEHRFLAKRGENTSNEKVEKLKAGSQTVVVLKVIDKSKIPAVLDLTSEPSGAEIFVDGKPAGTTPVKHEVDKGLHVIVAELDGHKPAEEEVRVVPGQTLALSLTLEEIVVVEEKPFPIAGIAVAGGGVLCLLGSMALFANAQYNKDQLDLLYRNGGTWSDTYAAHDATRKSSGVFSGIFGVLGGAAIAGGTTLIILNYVLKAPKKKAAAAPPPEKEADPAPAKDEEKKEEEKAPEAEKKPEAAPESSLMLVPMPGGAMATWTVTF